MRKYILLLSSLSYIAITIWQLYTAYAPRVGPIGNGPNESWVWGNFIFGIIGGLSFLILAIGMFIRDKTSSK